MRNNTKWIAAALLMGSLAAEAQENQILVKEKQVGRLDSQLVVGLTFDLHAVELASNRSLVCTPLLTRGDSVKGKPSRRSWSTGGTGRFSTNGGCVARRNIRPRRQFAAATERSRPLLTKRASLSVVGWNGRR